MTVKAVTAAFELGRIHDLAPVDRLILIAIGDRADDYGYAFPGMVELVNKVGVDARTIQRHLTALEKMELITLAYRRGGRSVPNLYRLISPNLPDDPEAPGLSRFLEIFGDRIKGDNLSPLVDPERATPETQKGDTRRVKGRHSSVTRSQRNHQDTTDNFSNNEGPTFPRLSGESRKDWIRRFTSQIGTLDT